jgi:hypothetical protein
MARLHLDIKRPATKGLLFDVPHKTEPMKVSQIEKEFPEFSAIMDGEAKENTMLFYWKYNKQTGVYEFISEEDEEEVAELMGVKLCTDSYEEEVVADNQKLNDEEIKRHQENIEDIRNGLSFINN